MLHEPTAVPRERRLQPLSKIADGITYLCMKSLVALLIAGGLDMHQAVTCS
jgi:hypothetical protein